MYNWYNLNISIFLFWYKNICWIYRSDMVHAEQVRIWKTKFIICPKRTMPKWTDEHAFSWFFVPKAWFQSPVSADDTTRNNQTTIPFQKKKNMTELFKKIYSLRSVESVRREQLHTYNPYVQHATLFPDQREYNVLKGKH